MAGNVTVFAERFCRRVPAANPKVKLQPGDVVLGQFPQSHETLAIFWRTMAAGGVFVPVDLTWPAYLIKRAAEQIAPRIIAGERPQLAVLQEIFPQSEPLLCDEAANTIFGEAEMPATAAAAYLFTSGSTGTPKAVVHSRGSLANSAAVLLQTFGWRPGERLLNLPEVHTMSGLRNALLAAPMGELKWIACPSAERANFFALLERIEHSACDYVVAGPSLVRQLALFGDRMAGKLSHVKAIYCTGAALSHDSARAVFEQFGVPVINYYGLTETGGICLSQRPEQWLPDDASLGEPVGCEVRLVPTELGGLEGELQVRSSQLMTGYLNDVPATKARFDGAWLKTGDIMHIDRAGRYHLRGREDLFIKTRTTERIHPEEVEAVIELHDSVAEAAVIGVPDPNGGERLLALTVLINAPQVDDRLATSLAEFVGIRLGHSRTPNEFRFVPNLPRLPSGKLCRASLQALVA